MPLTGRGLSSAIKVFFKLFLKTWQNLWKMSIVQLIRLLKNLYLKKNTKEQNSYPAETDPHDY